MMNFNAGNEAFNAKFRLGFWGIEIVGEGSKWYGVMRKKGENSYSKI